MGKNTTHAPNLTLEKQIEMVLKSKIREKEDYKESFTDMLDLIKQVEESNAHSKFIAGEDYRKALSITELIINHINADIRIEPGPVTNGKYTAIYKDGEGNIINYYKVFAERLAPYLDSNKISPEELKDFLDRKFELHGPYMTKDNKYYYKLVKAENTNTVQEMKLF